jgi:hypothetical protein
MDDLTQKRIESILTELSKCGDDTPQHRRDQLMALLHSIIATKQSNAAAKMEKQTCLLIWITWALLGLTVALLSFTIMLYKDAHQTIQHEQLSQEGHAKQPISNINSK